MHMNIYDEEYVDYLVENDEITPQEAGFMYWYDTNSFDEDNLSHD